MKFIRDDKHQLPANVKSFPVVIPRQYSGYFDNLPKI